MNEWREYIPFDVLTLLVAVAGSIRMRIVEPQAEIEQLNESK